ncbi:two-partner secretion domain-containing protein [Histophilus somni]|uniref:two-partner secretion domain-containing protein n=1 Tax=Histophilus somni TaxID=731 RepID=UPI00094AF4B5|nr:hemagglutinin repeat-containing protein [Histophilus somni]
MNTQHFCIIFSNPLQRLIVVSELAKSQDKSSCSSSVCSKSAVDFSSLLALLKPLCFSLFCALEFVSFSSFFSSAFAETLIIQADKSAPKTQQPIVLQTTNGLPQVNIQTPNTKGLSHNKYSQFDVAEKGVILNNSRTSTSTQLAGQVTANPYLAQGEAKVILNEINSSSPSVMKGYVEVAGGKADVIIANPSGLHCEGCGVINSGRVTLSTGKPEIKNGEVESFKVEAGKVNVSGKGLDNSRVDYTEILAREAEVNAGIWSKKEATVITGKNSIKRFDSDKTLQIIHTTQHVSGESQPQFSLDVAELGGMYSGKIYLIGTENGVGVRNAGHIGASSSEIVIDSQGKIVNTASGQIIAATKNRLKTDRTLDNAGKLYAEERVEVKAKENIEQTSSGVIRGRQNRIESEKSLINRGAVLGTEKTVIKATETVENIGTGQILGDKVAIEAGARIVNRDEQLSSNNNDVKSAVIAAHKRLDLAAPELINQKQFLTIAEKQNGQITEGPSLLSQGDLFVGRRLNSTEEVELSSENSSFADNFKNQSGLIDVAGNAYFGVKSLINSNEHLKTAFELQSDTQLNEHYLLPEGQPNSAKIDFNTLRWISFSRAGKVASRATELKERESNGNFNGYVLPMPNEESCSNLTDKKNCQIKPHSLYLPNDGAWSHFNIHLDEKVHLTLKDYPDVNLLQAYFDIPNEPEKPTRENNESEADFAKRLQSYETEKADYEVNKLEYQAKQTALSLQLKPYLDWLKANETQFEQLEKAIEKHNAAFSNKIYDRFWDINLNRRKISQTVVKQTAPGKILAGGDMWFQGAVHNDRSLILSGGNLVSQDENSPFKNTDEEGIHSTEEFGNHEFTWSKWRGGFKRYFQRKWGGRHDRHTVDNVTIPLNVVFSQTQGDYAVATTVQSNSQTTAPFIKITDGKGEIRFTQGTTILPSSSLYQINPQADSHILVETTPAFTDYRKWLSSDYMFNALRYDSNQVQKRLGDGYYEQRLVREQLYQLTGKLPSGHQQDFEVQYQALMDSAVKFSQTLANEFTLRPGVKLSKAQRARLTSDIVWLETETVTLPNGSQQEVLVPKVYLVANKADFSPLTTKGSLISANNIYAKNSELINQGRIFGREVMQLNGDSLHNQGTLSAQRLYVQTSGDLTNEGGHIEAQSRLALNVSGTFSHRSTTKTDESSNPSYGYHYKNMHLDRKALLHVKGEDGTLYINADNLNQIGSDIINSGTGDSLLNIKNSLKSTALSTQHSEKLGTGDHRRQETNQNLIISRIQSNSNIRLETDNLYTQSTAIETAKKLTALATNEMVFGAMKTVSTLEEQHRYKSGNTISKKSKETHYNEQQDNYQGSLLKGDSIALVAGDKLKTEATDINAKQHIDITAKDINLNVLINTKMTDYREKAKKSGLSGSLSNGVVSVGYQRNKTESNNRSRNEDVVATQLNAKGNIRVIAQHQLTLNATEIHSSSDTHLQGSKVNINAVEEHHLGQSRYVSKSGGVGVNMVYNPIEVGKEKYKQRRDQGVTNGIVGDELSRAEAITDTTGMIMRGIQPYIKHQSHQSNKQTEQVIAQSANIDTQGNLTVVATGGDIITQGATLSVEKDATFTAAGDVHFDVAINRYSQSANSSSKGFELNGLNKYIAGVGKGRENGKQSLIEEKGTVISVGGNSQTTAQQGDIIGKGLVLVSEGNNSFSATGDILFTTATTTQTQRQARKNHAIGEVATSETERFFGYHRERFNQVGDSLRHQGSQVVSLNGNVEINAGKDYHQTSSQILSKNKLHITAENIEAVAAHNEQTQQQSQSDLKIGQFSRIKSPIIDIIQTVERVVKNKEASTRLQTAQALGLAAQGYTLADSIYKIANKTPNTGYLIRVESGTGVAHSRQLQESEAHLSQGNVLNGKEVVLTTRDDNTESNAQNSNKTDRTLSTESRANHNQSGTGNIRLEHADIVSKDKDGNRLENSRIELNANKIEIEAGESRIKEKSRGQNVGVEVGMFAQAGAQTGVGVYATVGGGSQKANGESSTYHNSHLDAEHIKFNSQGSITLNGTTATAERIDVNAKGDLRIESKQDSNNYNSKGSQAGISVDVSFGNAWSVSGFASGEKGKSSYKQVNEQAGLIAGKGGYHIEANNVHLKGSTIASTTPNNSELRTNRLTFNDIQNESSHKATSVSISGTYGKTAPNITPSLPMHSQSNDSSITKATLTEGKITLNKDTNPIKTTAKALGINTDLSQANSQVAKPKEVKKLLAEQKEIAQAVSHISSAVNIYANNKAKETQDVEWQEGGSKRRKLDAVVATVGAILSGGTAGQVVVVAISPELNAQIHTMTKDSKMANLLAHALLSTTEAHLSGTNALVGATTGVAGEATAMFLSDAVFNR